MNKSKKDTPGLRKRIVLLWGVLLSFGNLFAQAYEYLNKRYYKILVAIVLPLQCPWIIFFLGPLWVIWFFTEYLNVPAEEADSKPYLGFLKWLEKRSQQRLVRDRYFNALSFRIDVWKRIYWRYQSMLLLSWIAIALCLVAFSQDKELFGRDLFENSFGLYLNGFLIALSFIQYFGVSLLWRATKARIWNQNWNP